MRNMTSDSPPNGVHRRWPAWGATGWLAVSSAVVGILLLVAGLCGLVLAANFGLEPGIWVLAIVLIAAGLAFLAGALKIMSAAKGAVANGVLKDWHRWFLQRSIVGSIDWNNQIDANVPRVNATKSVGNPAGLVAAWWRS